MMEHDYQAAIEDFESILTPSKHDLVALHALRLAQKVSEPSEGMIDAARGHIGHPAHYKSVFTAMIKQACAEIEDGQI